MKAFSTAGILFTLCSILTSQANALTCQGVTASDVSKVKNNRGAVSFNGEIRQGYRTYWSGFNPCNGAPDYAAFQYQPEKSQVLFYDCRGGQVFWQVEGSDGVLCY